MALGEHPGKKQASGGYSRTIGPCSVADLLNTVQLLSLVYVKEVDVSAVDAATAAEISTVLMVRG